MNRFKTLSDKEIKQAVDNYKKYLAEHPESIKVKAEYDVSISFNDGMLEAMNALVDQCDKEIAWHFTAERNVIKDDKGKVIEINYNVTNVFVPPQKVTGSTVNVDADKYMEWFVSCGTSFQGHGHSHVNMATGASGTDRDYQKDQLANLTSGFYIFLIMNKQGDINPMIYDADYNIHCEREDIVVDVPGNDCTAWAASEIKNKVTSAYAAKPGSGCYHGWHYTGGVDGQLSWEDYT